MIILDKKDKFSISLPRAVVILFSLNFASFCLPLILLHSCECKSLKNECEKDANNARVELKYAQDMEKRFNDQIIQLAKECYDQSKPMDKALNQKGIGGP